MIEEAYTNERIIPLLLTMGFMDVRNNHGILEFGKDVLFSKFDDFGTKKHYAAQVKVKDINGKKLGDLEEIINHIDRAFNVPFPDSTTKEYISIDEFFVITSKNYTGNAREQLARDQRIKKYGNRLHFFDGNRIRELERRNLTLYKERINGLIIELTYNKNILMKIEGGVDTYKKEKAVPLLLLKFHSIEEFLESFKDQNYEIITEMMDLYTSLVAINSILERFRLGLGEVEDQEEYIRNNFPKSIDKIESLLKKLSSLLKREF